MVRSAREFFYHANFRPDADRVSPADYKQLIAQVTSRDSRCPSPSDQKIVIPGFSNLHEFSEAFPDLLKRGCGTVRASYFQRGNWRMVFPFTRYGQSSQSEELQQKIELGLTPIVHLTDFPTHTINHVILLYSMTEQDGRVVFNGYDPNNPTRPAELIWADHQFTFERNNYFTGGKVNVYEVYKNVLF